MQLLLATQKMTVCTKTKGDQSRKQWNCHSECKVITDTEVAAIVHLKQAFDKPMHEVRSR